MKQKTDGFTLMEMLVVVSLFSIVALVLYSNFAGGVRVFTRLNQSAGGEDLSIFLDKLNRDFQNAFAFSDLPFEGKDSQVVFTTQIHAAAPLGGERSVGRMTVYYDPESNTIFSRKEDMSQIFQEKVGTPSPLLRGVQDLQLSYFEFDPLEKSYVWIKEWDPENAKTPLPVAVRIEMWLLEEGRELHVTKTFPIPVGG